MSTGAFHEGANFAAVQKAPLVVVADRDQRARVSLHDVVETFAEGGAGCDQLQCPYQSGLLTVL